MSTAIASFIATISWYMIKASASTIYKWWCPNPPNPQEKLSDETLRQLLEELKRLQKKREDSAVSAAEKQRLDEEAYDKMAESCPNLLSW